MPSPEIIKRVIAALNQAAIPHMFVGSFARNYIHHWTALHGSRAKLDTIRASIPPLN